MIQKPDFFIRLLLLILCFQMNSCKAPQSKLVTQDQGIPLSKLSGGSSGMEKIGDQSYLVVYDVKSYKTGTRMAMLQLTDEDIKVSPIQISGWDEEGISSDLESICKIPGKANDYFIAEAGNWEGGIGRIFHIQVDTTTLSGKILGTTKLPYRNINTLELVGDQYESMLCLPYSVSERILVLGERGGSNVNPRGIIRWGVYNLETHQLKFSDEGMQGIPLNAPGHWSDEKGKRDLTDLHIDTKGGIWASASEDISEVGPFYSTIYKIGDVDTTNKERPFNIYSDFPKWEAIPGFKIEALSGPSNNINCTHSFGTEDEIYGGVWRTLSID